MIRATAILLMATALPGRAVLAADDPVKYAHEGAFVVRNTTLIDGLGNPALAGQDVIVQDGRIASMGPHGTLSYPKRAKIIDGAGLTVLPGLIDNHAHLPAHVPPESAEGWRPWLNRYLYGGVTTLLDIASQTGVAVEVRDKIARGEIVAPRLITVGTFIDGPTDRVMPIPSDTIRANADVAPVLERHKSQGIHLLKAYVALPAIQLGNLVDQAHKQNMRVVVDASGFIGNSAYTLTGVDGYAHMAWHADLTDSEIELMKKLGTWTIGTVSIVRAVVERTNRILIDPQGIANDPLVTNVHTREDIAVLSNRSTGLAVVNGFEENLRHGYGDWFMKDWDKRPDYAMRNVKRMIDLGALVGMGSDAGFLMSDAMHYELEVWVKEGGVAPLAALRAATHDNARILQIEKEVGSLQPGLKADLLIVAGNPAQNISDIRKVRYVVRDGKIVDRESIARLWQQPARVSGAK